ncbi:MAG: efflux RND transporter periplasmic adaptor subunit [Elusimicrobia bacterium]|nr:efflux RND transporter periplasmic adaptor subunit [Elusimicrobiota bacterium]
MNAEAEKEDMSPRDIAPNWKTQCLAIVRSKAGLAVMAVMGVLIAVRVIVTRVALDRKTSDLPMVSVVAPNYQPMEKLLKLPADVEGLRQASIYAHVDGYLKKLYVDEGDEVKAGQLMADIDAPDIVQAYNRAKADDDFQQATKQRYEQLVKGQVISEQEYDDIVAKAAEARAALQNAAANMAYTHIVAPFSGQVARRFNYPGDLITKATENQSAKPIFIVVDESVLRVSLDVPQIDVEQVRVGSRVDISVDSFPNRVFQGKVTRIDDLMKEGTKTRRVLADIENPDGRLHAGMFGTAAIIVEHKERALTLPREALRGEEDNPFVFVAKDGVAKRVPVKVGLNTITDVEIVSGVSGGDQVILQGGSALADGMKVDVQTPAAAAAAKKADEAEAQ